jgi:UDP-N-acetylglucosamine--N-acetylmuramyl-(pentapeptide) pyrophosphoryl-undecaprenol N-acetylglucosamine transferase
MIGPVLIAAGGTGGHMFPALALGEALRRRGRSFALLTDQRGLRYVANGDEAHLLSAGSPSGSLRERVAGMVSLGRGLLQAIPLLRRLRPVAAAAFGGYASVPAALAASLARVPLLVHEQNAVFGKANRLAARFARRVALSFAETAAVPDMTDGHRLVTGNPVRPGFAAAGFYVPPGADGPCRVLVLGGSQGARVFSDVVPAAAARLPAELRDRLVIAQQCRPEDLERARKAYAEAGLAAELATFFEDVSRRMAEAHLVVARSGASTVAELLLLARPSLLVPYPFAADDHQAANAARLAQAGAARHLSQAGLDAERLAAVLEELMRGPAALAAMAQAARGLARPDAAEALADAVLALAEGNSR